MPIEYVDEQEEAPQSRIVYLDDEEVSQDPSLLQRASSIANEINLGITNAVPGLNYFTAKYLGIGVDTVAEGEQPSVGQAALRMPGMAAAYGVGMLAAPLRMMAAGPQVFRAPVAGVNDAVKYFTTRAAEAAVAAPKTTLALETISAAAAGAAGQAAYDKTGSEAAKVGAEMVAGVGAPLAVAGTKVLWGYTPIALAARRAMYVIKRPQVQTDVKPGELGVSRAQERLQEVVPDTEDFLRRSQEGADILPGAKLTTGERLEMPELLALERAIIKSSEDLKFADQARFDDINQVIRSAADELEPGQASGQDIGEYYNLLLDKRIEIAGAKLNDELASLTPKMGRQQANTKARQVLDKAYDDAIDQEKEIWATVPDDAIAPAIQTMRALKTRLMAVEKDRVAKDVIKVPPIVAKHIGRMSPKGRFIPGLLTKQDASLKELQSLRSVLTREIRAERALDAPDRRKISLLNDLQESLLSDMSVASKGDDAIGNAIRYSRSLNTKFRQGDVGTILGFSRTGEPSVPSILTLESTIARGGRAGAPARQAVNELLEASGSDPEMRSSMEDFLTDEFLINTVKNGEFNPKTASNYVQMRKELLDAFPALQSRFEAAINAGNAMGVAQGLKKPSQSAAAVVLKAPPGKELDRIVGAPSPSKAAKELMKEMDGVGHAPAMRRVTIDWLMDKASMSALDSTEKPFVSGLKLQAAMSDPAVSQTLKEVLTPAQLKRLNTIRNTALRAEISKKAVPAQEGVMQDLEGMVSETARRVFAAAAGRRVGQAVGSGGTVQIPGIFVQTSNRLRDAGFDPARKLIIDAVMAEDDKLLKSILTVPQGQASVRKAQNQLNAWALGVANEYGFSFIEE